METECDARLAVAVSEAVNGHVTVAERVLRAIAATPRGLRLSEIQRAAWEATHPVPMRPFHPRRDRGWWCTNLLGTVNKIGLLENFCVKDAHRRYHLSEEIARPFFRATLTKTGEANARAALAASLLREREAAKCPGCWGPVYRGNSWAPDGGACWRQWAQAYQVDCRGRVWAKDGELLAVTSAEVEEFCRRETGSTWAAREVALNRLLESRRSPRRADEGEVKGFVSFFTWVISCRPATRWSLLEI